MKNPVSIKNILSSIFKRKGGGGERTRLFEDLEGSDREMLLARNILAEDEFPIFGSFRTASDWLMITTERIICESDDVAWTCFLKDIRDVVVDFRAVALTGRKKIDLNEVLVVCAGGEKYKLSLESGPPLTGIWNALKNVGNYNRKQT